MQSVAATETGPTPSKSCVHPHLSVQVDSIVGPLLLQHERHAMRSRGAPVTAYPQPSLQPARDRDVHVYVRESSACFKDVCGWSPSFPWHVALDVRRTCRPLFLVANASRTLHCWEAWAESQVPTAQTVWPKRRPYNWPQQLARRWNNKMVKR